MTLEQTCIGLYVHTSALEVEGMLKRLQLRNIIVTVSYKIQLVEILIFTKETVVKTTEPGLTWPDLPD